MSDGLLMLIIAGVAITGGGGMFAWMLLHQDDQTPGDSR